MQCFSAGIRIIGDFPGQVCSLSNVSPRSGSFGLLTSTSDLGRRSWADTNSDGHAGRQLVDAGSGNVKYAVAPVLHQQSTQAMAKMVTGFCYALRRLSVVLFAESGGGPGNFKPEQIDPSSV